MIIYAVDDEELALKLLCKAIRQAAPDAELVSFDDPQALLDSAHEKPCDVAFLDIRMRGMSGLELARRLQSERLAKNIIFVTGYDQYAKDAFDLFASGYVAKPVRANAVVDQLEHLRVPMTSKPAKRVFIRTFGNFEVFVDGHPVRIHRSKSKEILAFLVDKRSTGVTTAELEAGIWEDADGGKDRRAYIHVLITGIRRAMEAVGVDNLLIRNGSEISLNDDVFDCDLYQLLDGDPKARQQYTGQYLPRYSWAETTAAYLHRLVDQN